MMMMMMMRGHASFRPHIGRQFIFQNSSKSRFRMRNYMSKKREKKKLSVPTTTKTTKFSLKDL